MSERRVLVISFFYPPDPAVGGRRAAKFVQYLPDFGWSPTVLTADTVGGEPSRTEAPVHATPYASAWKVRGRRRVPAGAQQSRASSLRERTARRGPLARSVYRGLRHLLPMSTVRLPDATSGWIPFAGAEGRKILASGAFDAILSSAGPPSSHRVAARLQRASGLPWIADYRDLWSENHWDMRVAPFRWIESKIERRALRGARLLTTVAPTWARRLAEMHGLPAEVVYNGFDRSDYPAEPQPTPGFALTYVGTLIRPGQDPEPFLAALARLSRRSDIDLDRLGFQLRLLGTPPGALGTLPEKHGVTRWVRELPPITYPESLSQQAASDALLFLGWHDPQEGHITAKLFEYLGAGRPILAVGPPGGDVSDILRQCGHADLSSDPDAIAARLEAWLREFERQGHVEFQPKRETADRYTRRAQTERLARLLDQATAAESR